MNSQGLKRIRYLAVAFNATAASIAMDIAIWLNSLGVRDDILNDYQAYRLIALHLVFGFLCIVYALKFMCIRIVVNPQKQDTSYELYSTN